MRVLVDSSFYINRLRSRIDPARELLERAGKQDTELLTCGVVCIEVLRGVILPKAYKELADFLGCLIYVPARNAIWEKATWLAWELDRKGITMQVTDLVIAVSALEADAAVLAFDSDFPRVPGLRVISEL